MTASGGVLSHLARKLVYTNNQYSTEKKKKKKKSRGGGGVGGKQALATRWWQGPPKCFSMAQAGQLPAATPRWGARGDRHGGCVELHPTALRSQHAIISPAQRDFSLILSAIYNKFKCPCMMLLTGFINCLRPGVFFPFFWRGGGVLFFWSLPQGTSTPEDQ